MSQNDRFSIVKNGCCIDSLVEVVFQGVSLHVQCKKWPNGRSGN